MDVRPGYREWGAPPGLRHAVACVWSRAVPAIAADATLVLPDGCADLIWQAGRGVSVAGPDTGPWFADLAPGSVLIGVRLAPGAGGPALRTPLDDLRDTRLPLDDVVPGLGVDVPDDLPPALALERLLDAAAALVDAGPPDKAVRVATRLLADPTATVAGVCDDLGLSGRQLHRRCRRSVGYGPKTLQRVLRFRRFLAVASAARAGERLDVDLAGVAAATGYADQAHLTRECRQLSGKTPSALVGRRR